METTEQLRDRLLALFPGLELTVVTNPGVSAQHSLLLSPSALHSVSPSSSASPSSFASQSRALAAFLRDDPALLLDQCTNVTGLDWPEKEIVETTKVSTPDPANPAGPPKITEQKTKRLQPGYLEVVYHLYSIALRHGPVILRFRTANRTDRVNVPSLTPVWRSCEFQEREVFDLFGVHFDGHPDLRRILMWDEFKDHPMRRDYVEPDDYEWEPTPHGTVLEKAKAHYPAPEVGRVIPNPPPPSASTPPPPVAPTKGASA